MFTLNCRGKLVVMNSPLVMGIINATPDSFYEGSRFSGRDAILWQTEKMISDGADIIEIGGQSTRPGSERVSEDEELKRVVDCVQTMHLKFPEMIICVDTYYASVARSCVEAGASMINDVTAGNADSDMIPLVAQLQTPYVAMHMKGTPATMQQEANYDNVTRDVLDFFVEKTEQCRRSGVHDVIIDPGFGFGKTINHNFELLRNLALFKMLEVPLMVGLSRKSTIYRTLGVTPSEALNGTTVLNTIALINGADILRVHDVKEAKEVVKLCSMIKDDASTKK